MLSIADFCAKHHACDAGTDWALNHCETMREAWDTARAEWAIWIATRDGVLTDRELRLFVCWSVRQVWHLLTDERSRNAIEVAERYAVGEATREELSAARAAARAAADVADAAHAAADAAYAAARAARAAADVAYAAHAAADAARAAADAADAAARAAAHAAADAAHAATDVAYAPTYAARAAAYAAQAQWLRDNTVPIFAE